MGVVCGRSLFICTPFVELSMTGAFAWIVVPIVGVEAIDPAVPDADALVGIMTDASAAALRRPIGRLLVSHFVDSIWL